MTPDDIEKIRRTLENKLNRSFVEMVRSIRQENTPAELADKIARGDLTNLIEGIDIAVEAFATDISASYVRAGQRTAAWINDRVPRPVKFNIASESGIEWMEQAQQDMIRLLREDTIDVARRVIASGRARGLTDLEIGNEVQRSIGLNAAQYEHVETYRTALESGNYRNAIGRELADARSLRSLRVADEAGTFITPTRIDAMVERYSDNWIRFRAANIALSESNGAVHGGLDEAMRQAVASGAVSADDLSSTWITRQDKRVRHSHQTMHGQKRKFGQPFMSGNGNLLMYPGDPNAPMREIVHCRCKLRVALKVPLHIRRS